MRSLNSSDKEIEIAAQVTPSDVEQARETARRHGRGTNLNKMLEAQEMEDAGPTV